MRIEAVGFDFDHTLGLDNKLERTIGAQLLGGGDAHPVEVALAAFRYGARSIDEALAAIGIDPEEFRARVLEHAPEFVEPLPGAAEMLAELRRLAVPAAILSNGWSPLQELKAKLVGFEGPVLVSERIGVSKPSFAAFLRLEHTFGIAAQRIAYVGDDPVPDVCGALNAGMQAIWFDWEARSYPQDVGEPTARITALREVLRVVQGPLGQTAKPPA